MMVQKMQVLRLFCLAVLCLCLAAEAQYQGRRRGKYLKTELRGTDSKEDYTVKLLPCEGSFPKMEFRRMAYLTHHEVKLYEVLLETVTPNTGEGYTTGGSVEYKVQPGEYYMGEVGDRVEIKDLGPMANEDFIVAGHPVRTNAEGCYVDVAQYLLEPFDLLSRQKWEVQVEHALLGGRKMLVTRNLIVKEEAKVPGTASQDSGDLLENLGMDFVQLRVRGVAGLKANVQMESTAKPGDILPITVEVENWGDKPVSNLIARVFSSNKAFDGRIYYFGSIGSGKKRVFSRLFQVPSEATGKCYISIAFWNVSGSIPALEKKLMINILKPDEAL